MRPPQCVLFVFKSIVLLVPVFIVDLFVKNLDEAVGTDFGQEIHVFNVHDLLELEVDLAFL
jgi:hypothetical protein